MGGALLKAKGGLPPTAQGSTQQHMRMRVWGPLPLMFTLGLVWEAPLLIQALGAPEAAAARTSPLSMLLSAAESLSRTGLNHGSNGAPANLRLGWDIPPPEGPLHGASVVDNLGGTLLQRQQQEQQEEGKTAGGRGAPSSAVLCVSISAVAVTILAVCCFVFIRRLQRGAPKETLATGGAAAEGMEEEALPMACFLGRWAWGPQAAAAAAGVAAAAATPRRSGSRSSSCCRSRTPKTSKNRRGSAAPLYPSFLGAGGGPPSHRDLGGPPGPEEVGVPPMQGVLGPLGAPSRYPSQFPGESLRTGMEGSPRVVAEAQQQNRTDTGGLPTHLQQQVMRGAPPPSSGDPLGALSPSAFSKGPLSCRTSLSVAAAAAIDNPTTFALVTPCSGGPRELLHWGAPTEGLNAQEETDLSVFASIAGEIPNPPNY
ncbi:hypothetical protein Esti_000014 [Eimeria stiedai]